MWGNNKTHQALSFNPSLHSVLSTDQVMWGTQTKKLKRQKTKKMKTIMPEAYLQNTKKCNAEERDDEEGGMIFPAETDDHRTPRRVRVRVRLAQEPHPCFSKK